MATTLTVFRLGGAEANRHRVTIRLISDIELNELHRLQRPGSGKDLGVERRKAICGLQLTGAGGCNR